MAVSSPRSRRLRRAAWAAVLGGGLVAGVVSAQPAPPPLPQVVPPPVQAPAPEEAPPVNVPPPELVFVPPVAEEEVAPAPPPPPRERVAEKPVEEPMRRARYDVAVLQALDKVTAETLRFEAAVGRPVRWKGLIFTVRVCERSAPDEPVEDSIAYVTIESQPRPQPGKPRPPPRQAFRGWMYASSPSLNAMEHATYDAWVISCRAAAPVSVATR